MVERMLIFGKGNDVTTMKRASPTVKSGVHFDIFSFEIETLNVEFLNLQLNLLLNFPDVHTCTKCFIYKTNSKFQEHGTQCTDKLKRLLFLFFSKKFIPNNLKRNN